MSESVRCRIAPSPTGAVHLGLARTALFNWAFARRNGGAFLLRIEDTDASRSTKESELAILSGLRWLGIEWDEGPDVGGPYAPYYQTERVHLHRAAGEELVEKGRAYRCFCTHERLDALRERQTAAKETPAYDRLCRGLSAADSRTRAALGEPFTLRFAVPPGETRLADLIRGEVAFQNAEVDDWVMVRQDGMPTYNFCVVVDDIGMRITHVLRGEEHLVNTPKQILLYRALGHEPPEFAHLPLMLGTDKKKLSKRSGDVSLEDYRAKGYPKEAIVNFLCLQGWSLDGATELFSVDELLARFDIRDVGKSGSVFDPEKFLWMAGEYIRKDSVERVAERCAPYVVAAGQMTEAEIASRRAWYLAAVAAHQERIHLYSELPPAMAYLFAADAELEYDPQAEKGARKHEQRIETLRAYLEWLRPRVASRVDAAELREGTRAWTSERGLKFPQLFQPLRCALTGQAGGPDLFDVIALLGAPAALRRIERGIERLA